MEAKELTATAVSVVWLLFTETVTMRKSTFAKTAIAFNYRELQRYILHQSVPTVSAYNIM